MNDTHETPNTTPAEATAASEERTDARYYLVTRAKGGEPEAIVFARSQAQAIRHVARDQFAARVASQRDLVENLAELGVQDATKEGGE